MTISRDRPGWGGELKVECDSGCGAQEWAGTLSFQEFVDWLKRLGWRMNRVSDATWEHYCPACKGGQR